MFGSRKTMMGAQDAGPSGIVYLGGAAMGQAGTTGIFDGPGFLVTDFVPDIAPGDTIVFAQGTGSNTNRTLTQSNLNVIETFTQVYVDDSLDTNLAGYIMEVPDPVPATFYVTAGPSFSTADAQTFCFMAFRGVDNTNPLVGNVSAIPQTNTVTSPHTGFSQGQTEDDVVVKIVAGAQTRGGSVSYLISGSREPDTIGFFTASANEDIYDSIIGISCTPYQPAFGNTSAPAFDFSGANSTAYSSATYIFALRPAQ